MILMLKQVGRMTLGGLLALGYTVVVSYKRASAIVNNGKVNISFETIDVLGETFMVMRGTNRKTVGTEASRMGIDGPWITKSYLEMILERKGVPRLSTPPLVSNTTVAASQETAIIAPKPIRVTPSVVTGFEDLPQPWTRSPTKSKMEPVVAAWHFISSDSSQPDNSVLGIVLGLLQCLIHLTWTGDCFWLFKQYKHCWRIKVYRS
ncbi:uncharacterized protein LOC124823156 isoform X2 [Vigna umbellata]|uniref:uncharacterized protein LOC124823156 isoform X2 n=1 Tax=Vigna umbellata TaxID=87088 RepID=UPI001F5EE3A4|nr:uncharacterized protein LOC124823156 isoform X2 [Vigna umbellata]XP_047151267.1 uncharacterized protein LOC124823156 isoform X2 [Vigna umbellata]